MKLMQFGIKYDIEFVEIEDFIFDKDPYQENLNTIDKYIYLKKFYYSLYELLNFLKSFYYLFSVMKI